MRSVAAQRRAKRAHASRGEQSPNVVVERKGRAAKETHMAYSVATPNERSNAFQSSRQDADLPRGAPGDTNFQDHLQTYRGFVRGMGLFAAHALVILLLLYYFLM